jgi:hypothetical protein
LVEIFTLLKALEQLALGLHINDRYSRYLPTTSDGIAMDSVRFAILIQVNELLWSLGYQGSIDGTKSVDEPVRIRFD